MQGEQHKTLPQRYSKNVHCPQQSFLFIIMPVADIINAVIHTYRTHVAYDTYHIRNIALIPDGCKMMALDKPNCYAHVIRHKLVTLFTKSTEAILDDDYTTNNFVSASLDYDFTLWVADSFLSRHSFSAL
jgi:hypothetical protein